jgi:hypothetical protein
MRDLGYYVQTLPDGSVYVYANTHDAEVAIANVARARTAVITVLQHILPGGAAGGNVGDVARGFAFGGSPSRRSDGRITGPGGPLDDLVPAITNMGEHIRVANTEWIVPGFVATMQGPQKMSALTAGRADIVPRAASGRRTSADAPNPATGTGAVNRPTQIFHIGSVSLVIPGAFNLGSGSDKRRLIQEISDGLVSLQREIH